MITSLSQYEMQLVTDAEVLLSKNKIIQTVYTIFGDLAEVYTKDLDRNGFNIPNKKNAKISKGENYGGLPYVIMDYPGNFSRDNIFAIRSFFWWGHFFSITLHLAGSYLQDYYISINNALEQLGQSGWQINAGDKQWEHHFEEDNYKPIVGDAIATYDRSFIKLAKKIPLKKWDEVNDFYTENFSMLIKILST